MYVEAMGCHHCKNYNISDNSTDWHIGIPLIHSICKVGSSFRRVIRYANQMCVPLTTQSSGTVKRVLLGCRARIVICVSTDSVVNRPHFSWVGQTLYVLSESDGRSCYRWELEMLSTLSYERDILNWNSISTRSLSACLRMHQQSQIHRDVCLLVVYMVDRICGILPTACT